MKIYTGSRITIGPNHISVINGRNRKFLKPSASQKLYNHSPDGFNWGYSGSGPAQSALAILLDCLGKELALKHYQAFKFEFVSSWGKQFSITEQEIKNWINSL